MAKYHPLIIEETIRRDELIFGVLSQVKKGVEKTYTKVDIKPVLIKEERVYHITYYYDKKVLHENVNQGEAIERIQTLMVTYFKQAQLFTVNADLQILMSKDGTGTVLKKPATRMMTSLSHNRQKQYLIQEGTPCDFMIRLGIMDENGKVYKKMYDKYRQLNKYLEFVEDSLPYLPDQITIVDFGCGKAYLTFALYYYLVKILKKEVRIIGLDLKEDVISFCNGIAEELGYDTLEFLMGDIKDYESNETIDMVVSLHACDTATDEAIGKAVKWHAKVIYAVPCCQHELFSQLDHEEMKPLLKYGVVRDKVATVVTDTLRACALEASGYSVQLLEFIDMVHTPKNILIRATLQEKSTLQLSQDYTTYEAFKNAWSVNPRIDAVLSPYFVKNTNI